MNTEETMINFINDVFKNTPDKNIFLDSLSRTSRNIICLFCLTEKEREFIEISDRVEFNRYDRVWSENRENMLKLKIEEPAEFERIRESAWRRYEEEMDECSKVVIRKSEWWNGL